MKTASLTVIKTSSSKLSFVPNPTTGILNISNFENLQAIQIVNLQGKVVMKINKPQNQVDLSELPNGIYFVQNTTSNGIETHKVILRK